jgi:hypothetical protein
MPYYHTALARLERTGVPGWLRAQRWTINGSSLRSVRNYRETSSREVLVDAIEIVETHRALVHEAAAIRIEVHLKGKSANIACHHLAESREHERLVGCLAISVPTMSMAVPTTMRSRRTLKSCRNGGSPD